MSLVLDSLVRDSHICSIELNSLSAASNVPLCMSLSKSNYFYVSSWMAQAWPDNNKQRGMCYSVTHRDILPHHDASLIAFKYIFKAFKAATLQLASLSPDKSWSLKSIWLMRCNLQESRGKSDIGSNRMKSFLHIYLPTLSNRNCWYLPRPICQYILKFGTILCNFRPL